jgi:hypothetical protein
LEFECFESKVDIWILDDSLVIDRDEVSGVGCSMTTIVFFKDFDEFRGEATNV